MPEYLDHNNIKALLDAGKFQVLFLEYLGWDICRESIAVDVDNHTYELIAIAEKRGMVAYKHLTKCGEQLPNHNTQFRISKMAARLKREHIIVFVSEDENVQCWQKLERENGKSYRRKHKVYKHGQSGQSITEMLQNIVFTLQEESDVTLMDVSQRTSNAFDVDGITNNFYIQYGALHDNFSKQIRNVASKRVRYWYASFTLYRLMFLHFIQRRGFLDSDVEYLQTRLKQHLGDEKGGKTFFKQFLTPLFHNVLGKHPSERQEETNSTFGHIPYLNGGIFEVHQIEIGNQNMDVPDRAFSEIFDFFNKYHWHLDEREFRNDREINPDVLGNIFEKYINNKQSGAYYTKEDVTRYMCRYAILPKLLRMVDKESGPGVDVISELQVLINEDQDKYMYQSRLHGLWCNLHADSRYQEETPLPTHIAEGCGNVLKQSKWDELAPEEYALPTETWRTVISRRKHSLHVRDRVRREAMDFEDFITLGLDLETMVRELVQSCEREKLITAFWNNLTRIRILDPTCGSGAFLFASMKVLEPLYTACIDAMRRICADSEEAENNLEKDQLEKFYQTLEKVDAHRNERYYVLKQIAVNNLFGVDYMEEAVEICKLRLFLKLIAEIDNVTEIEPLPDIDFNIVAGNALTGFGNATELKRVLANDLMMERELTKIITQIATVDVAAKEYRRTQLNNKGNGVDGSHRAKNKLTTQLLRLRCELDRCLAMKNGVDVNNNEEYEKWAVANKPFHWIAEHYGIMSEGGFDVIVGNPPYVASTKVEYALPSMNSCMKVRMPNLFGYLVSRTIELMKENSGCAMIVPLAITFDKRYKMLRERMLEWGSGWFSSFGIRPASLFTGVEQRCTIWLGQGGGNSIYIAPFARWKAEYRPYLMENIEYTETTAKIVGECGIPRLTGFASREVFGVLRSPNQQRRRMVLSDAEDECKSVYYSKSAGYFVSASLSHPEYYSGDNFVSTPSTKVAEIKVIDDEAMYAVFAAISGDLFYWYWLVRSNELDVTRWTIQEFIEVLDFLPDSWFESLSMIGKMLDRRKKDNMVLSLYNNNFVEGYNYRQSRYFTRRSDLLIMGGVSISRPGAYTIFDYIQRMDSIGQWSGNGAIPKDLLEICGVTERDVEMTSNEMGQLESIDCMLKDRFSLSDEELEVWTSSKNA